MRFVNKTFRECVEKNPWWAKLNYVIAVEIEALKTVLKSGILDFFSVQALQPFFDWQCVSVSRLNPVQFPNYSLMVL